MINDSSQDFNSGVDFTGIASPEGADFNNGVDLATPVNQTDDTQGKGLVITTTDTAANIPDVPNPATSADYAKWKRYQWNRRPFAGSVEKGFQVYHWNDDAIADVTLLKWLLQFNDTSAIEAIANNALATAGNAVIQANNANALAGTASNNATTALNTATTAQTDATNAQTTADAAQADATSGITQAQAAQNNALLALSLSLKQSSYVKVSETQPKGTDAGASAAGKNTRVLNTVDHAGVTPGIALNVLSGVLTVTLGDYYLIEAEAIMFDNSDNQHQLFVVDNASNNNLLEGLSEYFVAGGSASQVAKVRGIIQLVNGQAVRLDHYIANAQAANGLGKASNVNPDAAGKEVYATLTMILIGGN